MDLTPLITAVARLEQVLREGGNEAAEQYARLHTELQSGPEADRTRALVEEIRASARITQTARFDAAARLAYAEMWAVARALLASLEDDGGRA